MLDVPKLINIQLFLERAPATGKEALAWSETYMAVLAEIKEKTTVPAEQVPA